MAYINYFFFRVGVFIFSLLPYNFIHFLSNGLAYIFQHLLKYRAEVVWKNLKKCFPEFDDQKIAEFAKASYQNLADITLEGIKGLSDNHLEKRFTYKDFEEVNQLETKNQSYILAGAHLANWEWGPPTIAGSLLHHIIGIFKPVKNKLINDYIIRKRSFERVEPIPMKDVKKAIQISRDKPTGLVLIADQSPSNFEKAIWVDFLGIDTPCLHGVGEIAVSENLPVYYISIRRVRRGHYQASILPVCKEPALSNATEITQDYMQLVEADIRSDPGSWLWSHKRWKKERKDLGA